MNDLIYFFKNYQYKEDNELEFRIKLSQIEYENLLSKFNEPSLIINDTIYKNLKYRQRQEKNINYWIEKIPLKTLYLEKVLDCKLVLAREKTYKFTDIIKNIDKDLLLKKNIQFVRNKKRTTFKSKSWIFDLTMIKNLIPMKEDKWFLKNIEYELEIELKKNINNPYDTLNEIIEFLLPCNIKLPNILLYYSFTNTEKYILKDPITLEQKDLDLIKNNYSITLKMDGERKFLINGFLLDKNLSNSVKFTDNKFFQNCFLDGEYYKNKFYIFDILFYNNENTMNLTLIERQKLINNFLNIDKNIKIKIFYYSTKPEYKLSFVKYSKSIFNKGKKLIDDTKINNDGLILTPINENYNKSKIFKWKPVISLDVLYLNNDFFVGNKHKYYNITNDIKINNLDKDLNNKIIELEFNNSKWEFLKERPDKLKPNAYLTYKSILNAINFPVIL